MSYNFIRHRRDQSFLLPEDMRDWIPEGDLALFVVDLVEEMDLSPLPRQIPLRWLGKGGL